MSRIRLLASQNSGMIWTVGLDPSAVGHSRYVLGCQGSHGRGVKGLTYLI